MDFSKCLQMTLTGEVLLDINVQPGSSKQGIVGFDEWKGALKIAVKAKAVDGKANNALIYVLSELFSINKNSIVIQSGKKSRNKKIKITNQDVQLIKKTIQRHLE